MGCNYIYKKGKNKGETCEKIEFFNNMCKRHFKLYNNTLKDKFCIEIKNSNNSELTKTTNTIKISLDKMKELNNKWFDEIYKNEFIHNLKKNIILNDDYYINVSGLNKKIPHQIDKWILSKKIGSGGFGVVFECFDINNLTEPKAIKIESRYSDGLYSELNFYKLFKFNKYIPKIYQSGVTDSFRYVVLEKLYKIKILSQRDIPNIIRGLESFANIERIHGDIKLENIMTRKNGDIVFIDFGLSWRISKNFNIKNKSGTLAFMSINAHLGYSSYRNDLESLCYMIMDRLYNLPWRCRRQNSILRLKQEFLNNFKIREKTLILTYKLDELPILYKFIYEVINIHPFAKPNYQKLINIFENN